MKKIAIKVEFKGGLGFVRFSVFLHGHQVQTIVIKGDDSSTERMIGLVNGVYLISADGVSPNGGTTIQFSEPTSPMPKPIPEGPIDETYVLTINTAI